MKLQRITYLFFLSVSMSGVSSARGQSTSFTAIDFPDAASTQPWTMNPRGDIVGSYTSADKTSHGFLLSGDRYTTIDYPNATATVLAAVNPRGDIVGQYTSHDNVTHGLLISRGQWTTFDYPSAKVTSPGAMNARGDIVGVYTAQDGTRHGFLYTGGQFTTVDVPGATTTVAAGISARGDIVGGFMMAGVAHGFLFRGGQFSMYDFPGASSTQAFAISARGEIAGRYTLSGVTHGFLYSGGQFTTVDFPGAGYTAAYFINSTDDVLGQYQMNGVYHGYVMERRVPHNASYTITDLGTLGGSASIAFGINDAGEIGGGANVAGESQHPFLWSAEKMKDLGTLGGPNANVGGPNGSRTTAGPSETAVADPNGEDFCGFGTHLVCAGAMWLNGAMSRLPTLGGVNAMAITLNDRDQAVGIAETNVADATCVAPQMFQFQAAVWGPTAGDIQVLPPPRGDTVGFALGNNDRGQVAGGTGTCANTEAAPFMIGPHAVMWNHGSPIVLGTLGGKTAAAAASINNRSEAVGGSFLADEKTFNTYLWATATGMIDAGNVGNDLSSYPYMINDSGQVVGTSCDTNMSGNCRAYIWQYLGPNSQPAAMIDMNTLIAPDAPYFLVSANAINNAGEVVGIAVDMATGDPHAFLATPSAAPGTMSSEVQPWRIPDKARRFMRRQPPAISR